MADQLPVSSLKIIGMNAKASPEVEIYCQAQSQLQLSRTELALILISPTRPATHPPNHPPTLNMEK